MSTYYKYVERSVDDQINWAEVGKNMSDMLKNEAAAREAKKAEINQASRQFGLDLSNAPTGDYDAGNTFAAEYANGMQEYRLMQDRMLKNGTLSLRDYARNRANSTDGTTQMFDLAKEYQAEYTEKMKRWEGDESSFREVWEMEQAEGLGNLRDVGGYINPTNGVISVGKKVAGEDGVRQLSSDPNDFVTVPEMKNRLKAQYNRFDVLASTETAADSLGEFKRDVVKYAQQGSLNTILSTIDAKDGAYGLEGEQFAANYRAWEDDQVSSMMVNPNDVSSVLTDYKLNGPNGQKYSFTYDKDAFDKQGADGNLIFLDRTENPAGKPVFTSKQETEVKEALKVAIRSQIDDKVERKAAGFTQYEPTSRTTTKDRDTSQENIVTEFSRLFYDDADGKKTAADAIRAYNPNIKSILPSEDGNSVVFTMNDGTTETIRLDDTNEIDFIKRGANFALPQDKKIADIDDVVRRSGKFKYDEDGNLVLRPPSLNIGFDSQGGQVTTLPFNEAFIANEGKKISGPTILKDTSAAISTAQEEEALSSLNQMITSIPGLSKNNVTTRTFYSGKGIRVVIDGKEFDIELDDATKAPEQFEKVKKALLDQAVKSQSLLLDEKGKDEYVSNYGTVKPNTGAQGGNVSSGSVPRRNSK